MVNEKKTAAKSAAVEAAEKTETVVTNAAKAVETKAEEVKAKTVPAVEEKEAAEKKKPGRKPGSKNKTKTTKTTTTKAAKKDGTIPEIYVQYGPDESSVQTVVEKIKAEYVEQGHRASSIKSLKVYLKPEDTAAYYVINDKVAGRVDLF